MTKTRFEQTAMSFMDGLTTMTLATCSQGIPWAAAVYYARQGLDLIFFSSPASRHSEILSTNPRAAATIHGEYDRWQDIKGLQMEGTVEQIRSTWALARATAAYLKRYPFVRQFLADPGSVSTLAAAKMTKAALYIFRPERIFYLSNEEGFGNRWKLEIRDGKSVGDPERA
ncbi:MAG: pyridoxamine 5'-phosphate oxidase family protein [Desulfomonilaceae bacterium]|nr:pyridoxamine 5'-phosphate oxidase family protein [Desulfomonilaceae bacterium]